MPMPRPLSQALKPQAKPGENVSKENSQDHPTQSITTSDPDVSELCVSLKDTMQARIKAGMATHEVQDLLYDLRIAVDAIDAAHLATTTRQTDSD